MRTPWQGESIHIIHRIHIESDWKRLKRKLSKRCPEAAERTFATCKPHKQLAISQTTRITGALPGPAGPCPQIGTDLAYSVGILKRCLFCLDMPWPSTSLNLTTSCDKEIPGGIEMSETKEFLRIITDSQNLRAEEQHLSGSDSTLKHCEGRLLCAQRTCPRGDCTGIVVHFVRKRTNENQDRCRYLVISDWSYQCLALA